MNPKLLKSVEKFISSTPQYKAIYSDTVPYVVGSVPVAHTGTGIPVRCNYNIKVEDKSRIQKDLLDSIDVSIRQLPANRTRAILSDVSVTEGDGAYYVSYYISYAKVARSSLPI